MPTQYVHMKLNKRELRERERAYAFGLSGNGRDGFGGFGEDGINVNSI